MESDISEIFQHIVQVARPDYYVYTFQALSVISTVAGGLEAYFGFMESFTTHQERITVFRSYLKISGRIPVLLEKLLMNLK